MIIYIGADRPLDAGVRVNGASPEMVAHYMHIAEEMGDHVVISYEFRDELKAALMGPTKFHGLLGIHFGNGEIAWL